MKYLRYTLVDNKTNVPVHVAPAKNGPKHPDGIVPTFAVESSFGTHPIFYGIADDDLAITDGVQEVSEDRYYREMRDEFKTRARAKKTSVEEGGYWVTPEMFIRTDPGSQNRLNQLVTTINNDPEITSIDFEVIPGVWTTLDTATSLTIAKTISRHVQRCFSWCKGVHEALDNASTLEEMLPIVQNIQAFKADDNPPASGAE